MTGLQTAYYIYAMVFMGIILALIMGMFIALMVIRAKIAAIHDRIDEKIERISDIAGKGSAILGTVKKVVKHAPK